ncbi:MAG: hypothetical protein H6973_16640 [Gammaproteobacteria bacterium]|nr:hypothetical protein [Gammaproteobacteria bacterium]
MAHKYLVDLTEEEREDLLKVIHKSKAAARKVARAHVLLQAAEGATDEAIAQSLHLGFRPFIVPVNGLSTKGCWRR